MSDCVIRLAEERDAPTILRLVRELAAYEELLHAVQASEADIRRDGFGPQRRFECLLAELPGGEDGDEAVGFALFFHNYSTFRGRPGLYLEDYFVAPAARGRGIGRALMARLAAIALERGCTRLDLAVLDWNPTRELYRHLGFEHQRAWLPYRLEGEGLRRLAEGG